MRRSAVVLGGSAAAALALLLLLVWFRRTQDGGANESRSSEPARTPVAALHEPATASGAPQASAAPSVESAQRDALEAAAAPSPTCLVRVVEAGSGKPLPLARVWIENEGGDRDGPEWWRAMRRHNDVEAVLASGFGHELALDERGEARVPRPRRTVCVAAALGSLHGVETVNPRSETCVIELKAYHALTVEVVDRAGKPVPRAQVVFFWGEFDPLEDSNTLPVDEEGRLVIAKLEDQIYEHQRAGPVRVTLAGGVPCEPALVEFTLDSVPTEPVRFVAGDHGSILVQLTDPQGRDLALEGSAHIEFDTYLLAEPALAVRAGARLDLPLDAGRAYFSCVGLGFLFEIQCSAKGHAVEWRMIPGPTTPGQELGVLVPLGNRRTIARGRVIGVGEAGTLRCKASSFPWEMYARVRDDGTFEFSPYGPLERLDEPWDLWFERQDMPTFGATAVPRVDTEQRLVDFREVVLSPLSTLARLRVVDDRGAPVVAMIEIESAAGADTRPCSKEGVARLEGAAERLPLRVRATHESWLPSEWLEITVPDTEATLTLRRGAALEGRVVMPRGANLEAGYVHLIVEDPTPEPDEYDTQLVEGGRFRFQACEAGVAHLAVHYADQPVCERTGIELVAGKTTQLPEIDLRAELHPFALTFALASGAPWRGGHLEVREAEGESPTWLTIGPSARAFLLLPRPALDVWVAGRGARPTLFEGVHDGDRLVLPDAPSIVLRLARDVPLPESPLELVVRGARVQPEEVAFETFDETDGPDAVAGGDGLVRLAVPWAGEYELAWCVRHAGTGVEFEIEPTRPHALAIDDSTAAMVVDALLTPEEVAEALLAATGR